MMPAEFWRGVCTYKTSSTDLGRAEATIFGQSANRIDERYTMATQMQRAAAQKNMRTAQKARKSMSLRESSRSQPSGRERKKPGAGGEGDYFHVRVISNEAFSTFRTQDVGKKGHVQRVAGKRPSGSWHTVKWLISKQDAHIEDGKLIADSSEAKKLLAKLGSQAVHIKADIFEAKPRRNVPKIERPTVAQRRARQENIKKAQAAAHKARAKK